MKRSLISLAVLQATAHAKSTETLAEAAGWLKPIITKEMKAGTQSMLADDRKPVHIQADKKPRYIKKISGREDLNPVSLADKRPIHIGGGCSDIDHGGGSGGIKCRPEGITKQHPAQFGQQQVIAASVAFA